MQSRKSKRVVTLEGGGRAGARNRANLVLEPATGDGGKQSFQGVGNHWHCTGATHQLGPWDWRFFGTATNGA